MSGVIPEHVVQEVQNRLTTLEREHEVRVLFAVESGSRAWGFPSPDSDYDVRFVYVHRRDHYLRIDGHTERDVIEQPIVDEIDLAGWDLPKALGLLRRSNPGMVEWLHSPIVYRADEATLAQFRELLVRCFRPISGVHHYLSMARTNHRDWLGRDEVRLKKYLYVIRPLLAARFIASELQPAPMLFRELLSLLDDRTVLSEIEELLQAKAQTSELGVGPARPILENWIASELARAESNIPSDTKGGMSPEDLSAVFRSLLDD